MGSGILPCGRNTAHFSPRFPSRTTCPCKTACLSNTWSAMVFSFPSVYRGHALTEPVCQWRRRTGTHLLAVKCWSVILAPNKVGTGDWHLKQIAPGLRESGGGGVCLQVKLPEFTDFLHSGSKMEQSMDGGEGQLRQLLLCLHNGRWAGMLAHNGVRRFSTRSAVVLAYAREVLCLGSNSSTHASQAVIWVPPQTITVT